jgi:uncharacterized membrane protein YbhN (UPF0104 family)
MTAVSAVTPFHDDSRPRRLKKIAVWLVGTALLVIVLNLLGVDVRGWLNDVWQQIKDIPVGYLVAGSVLQILQTTFNGLAYYGILSYAYPGRVQMWAVITAYAVGVSMNNFLPANIGTFVTLLMLVAIIPGSSFAGILAAYLVNKIFFTIVGGLVYLYMFVEAGSAIDVELGWFSDHPALALGLLASGAFLIVIAGRILWRKLQGLWEQSKQGGKILASPTAYGVRVLLPQLASYAAKVGVIIVFLAAYAIPVTFDSVVSVIGSSSAANMTAVTPGSVGITQAANVVALADYTDANTATAYSLSQQLVTTAVNAGFAVILVILIFGWTGGKILVRSSYDDAKVKAAEMKSSRKKGTDEADSTPETGTQ